MHIVFNFFSFFLYFFVLHIPCINKPLHSLPAHDVFDLIFILMFITQYHKTCSTPGWVRDLFFSTKGVALALHFLQDFECGDFEIPGL